MRVLSLFSGIGGIDLAAQWAGMETVAFCEIDKFCQQVLRKNFGQDVVIFDDVRTLTAESLRARGIDPESISMVVGGFPCQDISRAKSRGGTRLGLGGARSGLWSEYFRIICEIRPRFVLVENVSALLERGMGDVLRGLASIGYDAEWSVLSACAVGAPHTRERLFVVAYPPGINLQIPLLLQEAGIQKQLGRTGNADALAHWQAHQPGVAGMACGTPASVDRLKALGNLVVPQQVYPILKAIADYELPTLRKL